VPRHKAAALAAQESGGASGAGFQPVIGSPL